MKALRLLNIFYMLFLLSLLISCERDFESNVINTTTPSLEVVVKNAANTALPNATVKLYNNDSAWNAEGTAVLTKQTNAEGRAPFTQEELKEPGFFYIIATSGTLKVKVKTKYLLLTDGKTLVNLVLK